MTENFSCPRTCPRAGDRWCRFRPILDSLGDTRVDSHTVHITVKLKNRQAAQDAIVAMGGTVIGEGLHKLYETTHQGFAFRLPKWRYPIVLGGDDGTQLFFDDYKGVWGNVKDLEALKGEYSIQLATQNARNLGWSSEAITDGIRVHHPNGGHVDILRSGSAEAFEFQGVGCHDALTSLGVDGQFLAKEELGKVENKICQQI